MGAHELCTTLWSNTSKVEKVLFNANASANVLTAAALPSCVGSALALVPSAHLVPHGGKCCGKMATQVVAAVHEQTQQRSGSLGEQAEDTKGQMTCRI